MPDLLALNGQIIGGVPLPGKNYVKLWENPDPTATFVAQDIILSSDDYDFLLVISLVSNSATVRENTCIVDKGQNFNISGNRPRSTGACVQIRQFTYVNDTKYSVGKGQVATGTTAVADDNTICIPVAIYGIKKDALATEGGGVGGGHIIEDADGTDLDQQDILQFKGTLRATNDSTNGKTIVDDSAVEIEWSVWQNMTEAQRDAYLAEHPKVDVVGFPDADADLQLDFMTKLWENPNPTQAFGAQNITLASDDYDFLLAIGNGICSITLKGNVMVFRSPAVNPATGTNLTMWQRVITYVSDTEYSVGDCYYQAQGSSKSVNNASLIPIAIYGFKKKITVTVDAIAENVSTSASKCMLSDGETSVEDTLNYSTEEHVVGKWIDGSTLYEKTVDFGALPNNTTKTLNHNISNIKRIVEIKAIASISDGRSYPLPYNDMSNPTTGDSGFLVSATAITVVTKTNWSAIDGYFTLRYTKTS